MNPTNLPELSQAAVEALANAPGSMLWDAVLEVLSAQEEIESGAAAQPMLPADARAYNCGRLSLILDLQEMLPQLADSSKRSVG